MPNPHVIAMLLLTVAVFYLYTRPWIRMEYVSLILLTALLLMFYFFPFQGQGGRLTDVNVFQAFGHPALVAICSLMVLGRGLTMTGALDPAVRALTKLWNLSAALGLLLTLLLAGFASAFINDTPVLVLMLPMLLGLAERTGQAASRTVMPVNLAILAGGMLTSIGTSTNLLVLSIAADLGMKPLGLFSFTAIAATAFAVALPYLWLIAPRLLPQGPHTPSRWPRQFQARVKIGGSGDAAAGRRAGRSAALVGMKLADLAKKLGRPLPAALIVRGGAELEASRDLLLEDGDAIVLHDTPNGLREVSAAFGLELFDADGAGRFVERDDARVDTMFVEAVVGSDSELVGRTLREVRFAERYGLVVVGVSHGYEGLQPRPSDIGDRPLSANDILLMQGPADRIQHLGRLRGMLVLDASITLPKSPLALIALAIMAGVVLVAATKILPIHVAAFLGMLAMLFTGCVRLEGIGRALSLEVVLLVASSVALGQALVVTGAAAWIAGGVSDVVAMVPPAVQVAVFMAFAALLTNFVSNAAAAAVGTPIAIETAQALGLPLEPFVLAILFGANLSYATPMAYQTNVLIMKAAGYRFVDFLRVGAPLVALMLATLSILLAQHYGM
jgi:di/tricarboxylate transporter